MDLILNVPLAVMGVLQCLLSVVLLSPRPISLPIATIISKLKTNTAVVSVFGTICLGLAGLLASSCAELLKGSHKVQTGEMRVDAVGSLDFLRSQVTCVLSALNLFLMLLNPAVAVETRQLERQKKDTEAMKKQATNMQAEYERVTAQRTGSEGDIAPEGSEAEIQKQRVDRLLREKNELQNAVDAALQSKDAADVKIEAMANQMTGFDKEYDRVLEQNKQLQDKVAHMDQVVQQVVSKKDD